MLPRQEGGQKGEHTTLSLLTRGISHRRDRGPLIRLDGSPIRISSVRATSTHRDAFIANFSAIRLNNCPRSSRLSVNETLMSKSIGMSNGRQVGAARYKVSYVFDFYIQEVEL